MKCELTWRILMAINGNHFSFTHLLFNHPYYESRFLICILHEIILTCAGTLNMNSSNLEVKKNIIASKSEGMKETPEILLMILGMDPTFDLFQLLIGSYCIRQNI